jgi:hypothetical protein
VTAPRIRGVERPDGSYVVEVRRTGVEPSGDLLPGYVIAVISRLKWQLSGEKSWSLEVLAPVSRHRVLRSKRLLLSQVFRSESEALAAIDPIILRLESGEFDLG